MADNIAQDALDAQKVQRAIDLRVKGAHWSEIAQACGYASPAAAMRAVGEAMADATQRAEETADSMRDTANLRLEHLLREALSMVAADPETDLEGNVKDDRAVRLRAVDESRRIVESIVKLNGVGAASDETESVPVLRIVGVSPEDIV